MTDKNLEKIFYNINDCINAEISSPNGFIIACEKMKKDNTVGRYFVLFPSFEFFLKKRERYPHSHELLVDHKNNCPDNSGRLVFDFDIKSNNKNIDDYVPVNFKNQVEKIIKKVIDKYFNNIYIQKLKFIWSTSTNPTKFSKHLTVKHLYFNNWVELSKIFYKLFSKCWDKKYTWIGSDKLVDVQIVKKRTSLRMVGSKKIGGNFLKLDNPNHKFTDSLIRIYDEHQRDKEQLCTIDNINIGVIDKIVPKSIKSEHTSYNKLANKNYSDKIYDKVIYEKAFEILKKVNPGIFDLRKIENGKIYLIRKRASKCLISGNIHEHENAYLTIKCSLEFSPEKTDSPVEYIVYFWCYRYCAASKNKFSIYIGSLLGEDLKERISENLIKITKNKKIKNKKNISDLMYRNSFSYI